MPREVPIVIVIYIHVPKRVCNVHTGLTDVIYICVSSELLRGTHAHTFSLSRTHTYNTRTHARTRGIHYYHYLYDVKDTSGT